MGGLRGAGGKGRGRRGDVGRLREWMLGFLYDFG